jgi:hemolysin activation/secretion protein
MQFCDQSVLPLEKFSVGGAYSVRGYREDEFVRDNGVVASLELRYPAFRMPVPGLAQTAEDGMVQLAAFTDWGWSENVDTATPSPRSIGSVGLGVRWDPSPRLHAQLYWGIPLRDIDYPSDDLQNDGIHFQLNCRIF